MKSSFLTIGRKCAILVTLLVGIGFALVITIQTHQQRTLIEQTVTKDYKLVVELLAAQLSGAFRWNKPLAIENAFATLRKTDSEGLAALEAKTNEGKVLVNIEQAEFELEKVGYSTYINTLSKTDEVVATRIGHLIVVSAPVYDGKTQSYSGVLSVSWSLKAMEQKIWGKTLGQYAIGLGIILFVGLAIIILLQKLVSNPVAEVSRITDEISRGNLNNTITTSSKDEIGQLMTIMGGMQTQLKQMIGQVDDVSGQLSQASQTADSAIHEQDKLRSKQHDQIQLVVIATNEMIETSANVEKNAEVAAESVKTTKTEVESGHKIVAETITSINALSNEVSTAAQAINTVKQNVDNINAILDTIHSISEQTNLLALNAAIEAARAGEQGRGFAVVADEVRTLAGRTQNSTHEIKSMIEALQHGANEAHTAMSSGEKRGKDTVDIARQAGIALEKVTHAVKTISDINTQVATASTQQTIVSQNIYTNIQTIENFSVEEKSHAQDTHDASASLGTLAKTLNSLVRKFNI